MIKRLLGETFEQLGEIPKQVGKQMAKLPTDIVQGAVKSVVGGGKGLPAGRQVDPLTGIEVPSPQKIKQLKKQESKRKAAAIPHAQQIIAAAAKKGQPLSVPAYIAGKPGFSEEKKELPPPVSASKPKMGTGERKTGVSG